MWHYASGIYIYESFAIIVLVVVVVVVSLL